jgi:NAD(P)-dependent dehydrogenase (short-subunit alcohol dehydrogenase family)
MSKKIWLITGISSGLGHHLAQKVIAAGDFAIGTFRRAEQAEYFNQIHAGRGLGLVMDVTQPAQVQAVFQQIETQFGRLDVLVNNAGVGFGGAIEEASMAEVRAVFEVNVFGALLSTQLALPMMRAQQSGHIFQISSGAGLKATPGFGIYNATKFALEGFSEALADEVGPLGIRVTIVEPGPFRTQFAGSSFWQAASTLEAYAATAGAFRKRMTEVVDGHQEGDPAKAADILLRMAREAAPPLRLPLGKIVFNGIQAKLDSIRKDVEAWRSVAESAVF